jgi:hypothetical protein
MQFSMPPGLSRGSSYGSQLATTRAAYCSRQGDCVDGGVMAQVAVVDQFEDPDDFGEPVYSDGE